MAPPRAACAVNYIAETLQLRIDEGLAKDIDMLQLPLIDDRAYLTDMAQAVYRGDALYGSTTLGYPPYAPLMTAPVAIVAQTIRVVPLTDLGLTSCGA